MLAAVLFGLFLVVLLLGVPIGFSMGFLTIAAFEVGNGPLITNIILIILGCVLDQSPALLMMVPILLPIATQFGIDPVHFGVLCCFNLTIGLISPPVGMTLFVTANVAKVKLTALFKEVIPFVVLGYATLFLITYVPQIVTFIPNLLK